MFPFCVMSKGLTSDITPESVILKGARSLFLIVWNFEMQTLSGGCIHFRSKRLKLVGCVSIVTVVAFELAPKFSTLRKNRMRVSESPFQSFLGNA